MATSIISNATATKQQQILQQVSDNQQLLQQWSKYAPMNQQHRWHLVEAERYRVLGDRARVMECYDLAISLAKENGYIHESALSSELSAKFYLAWGREKIAAVYMQQAYYCYAQWGAKAKIDDLEKRYPQLLSPILQRQQLGETYILHDKM